MKPFLPLFICLVISACSAPYTPARQGAGFQGIGSSQPVSTPAMPAPTTAVAPTSTGGTGLQAAADAALNTQLNASDTPIDVGGHPLVMRVVQSQGYSFAVAQRLGPKPRGRRPRMSLAVMQTIDNRSSCGVGDQIWSGYALKENTKFVVQLIC